MQMAKIQRDKTNPNNPTRAIPGSREKLEVLSLRAQEGETLFHTDDAAWREAALVAWLKEASPFRAAMLSPAVVCETVYAVGAPTRCVSEGLRCRCTNPKRKRGIPRLP